MHKNYLYDELVQCLVAREKYEILMKTDPKPYDHLVMEILKEQIDALTARLNNSPTLQTAL